MSFNKEANKLIKKNLETIVYQVNIDISLLDFYKKKT